MIFKLYCSSRHVPDEKIEGKKWPILQQCNGGFKGVMYLLWLLSKKSHTIEILDTAYLSETELKEVYASVVPLAVSKKYGIRRVFGTKHQSGIRFGVAVPALLVFEQSRQPPKDVYPHIETVKEPRDSYYRTIYWHLRRLLNRGGGN